MRTNLEALVTEESKSEFYHRANNDSSIDRKPFDANNQIIEQTWNLVYPYSMHSTERARSIFNWMNQNFTYDKSMIPEPYLSASETFSIRRGVCREFAFLYTTMARIAGFKAYHVGVFNKRGEMSHECSAIKLQGRLVLVDVAYHQFDIYHKDTKVFYDDEEAIARYMHFAPQTNTHVYYHNPFSDRKWLITQVILPWTLVTSLLLGSLYIAIHPEARRLKDDIPEYFENVVSDISQKLTFEKEVHAIEPQKIIPQVKEILNIEPKEVSDERNEALRIVRFNSMVSIIKVHYHNSFTAKKFKYPEDEFEVIQKFTAFLEDTNDLM